MTMALRTNARPAQYEQPDAASTVPEGMVWVEGGTFVMGSNQHHRAERPAHEVRVNGFWIDRTCVTNEQFARFVRETGYVTLAERPAHAADDPGANWRHPLGPSSSIELLHDRPVVHVAFQDAIAYATWAAKRLPTEAEWEFAARGGLKGAEFAGGELRPTWQGELPYQSLLEDGHEWASHLDAVPANGGGLFDTSGNFIGSDFMASNFMASDVWQWTVDWYVESCDPRPPNVRGPRKAIKGGSSASAANSSRRDGPAARRGHPIDASSCHVGFRCVIRYDGLLP